MARTDQDQFHCPYLGKVDDRQAIYNQATRRHRCYRWERSLPVKRQDQEQYCLSPLHVSCPRLTDPNALPVPEGQRRRRRRSLRILGMPIRRAVGYVVPMLLLFGVAIASSLALVRHLSATPLPTAVIALASEEPTPTPTGTTTPFPTWTPTVEGTASNEGAGGMATATQTPWTRPTPGPTAFAYEPTATTEGSTFSSPLATPTPGAATFSSPLPTPTPSRTATPGSGSTFDSPLDTPTVAPTATRAGTGYASVPPTRTPEPAGTVYPTSPAPAGPYDFVVVGEPVKTLLPGGVDVCARVFGRVYDQQGIVITNAVGMIVEWWPDNQLKTGVEGWPPINPDGTYEFCLTRGQYNLSVLAPKRISQQWWLDTDEPEFTGQVVLEINFQLVR